MKTAASEIVCSDCGAKNHSGRVSCWLCGKPLLPLTTGGSAAADRVYQSTSAQSLPPSTVVSTAINEAYHTAVDEEPQTSAAQFTMGSIFLVTTLAAILCAVFVLIPGLGILLAFVSAPPLIRTTLVVNRIKQSGSLVSPQNKILLFLSSVVTTIVISSVSLIVAVGSFCTVCLSAGTESAIPFALLISVIITGLVLWGFALWIRGRWRRDTKRF
jgi:uncharacterized membrane protein